MENKKENIRTSGFTIAFVLGILSLIFSYTGQETKQKVFLFLSLGFIFISLFIPVLLKPINFIAEFLAKIISKIISIVLTVVLFYTVITIYAIIIRITGKKLLDLNIEKDKDSYWIILDKKSKDPADYTKLY